jgi:hypothetical protein
MAEHPETQHFPHPRATTAAWEVMPPLSVRIPAAACMPPTSSGLVSALTYIGVFPEEKLSLKKYRRVIFLHRG